MIRSSAAHARPEHPAPTSRTSPRATTRPMALVVLGVRALIASRHLTTQYLQPERDHLAVRLGPGPLNVCDDNDAIATQLTELTV